MAINILRLGGLMASALLLAAATPALAVQRTFVASFGNDANACSIISPCRGIARALTQTDAGGEVIVLDSAGYGGFTVTQSVSIIAPDGVYAGISVFPGLHGIRVIGAGINVTLRGLTINGQGGDDGIRIENAGTVFIEKVTVAGTGNLLVDAGIRVAATATNARVFVTDTTLRGNAGSGIQGQANTSLRVDRCRIEGNGNRGILFSSPGGRLTVTDSLVADNQNGGIEVHGTGAGTWDVTVARSTVDGNGSASVVVGAGTGGPYSVAVTGSVLRRNGGNGVLVGGNPGETFTAVVADNEIAGNDGAGISCTSSIPASLVAARNEVVGNFRAFGQAGNCNFQSMGNNAATSNPNPDLGTISTVPLR